MDYDTLTGMIFSMTVIIFIFTWRFNPLNPEFNILPGMVLTKQQIATYFVAIIGIVTIVFLWTWVSLDDRLTMKRTH